METWCYGFAVLNTWLLRKNHSGMETRQAVRNIWFVRIGLRKNHSGMETNIDKFCLLCAKVLVA